MVVGVDELMGVTGAEFVGPVPDPLSVPPPVPPPVMPPVDDCDELEDLPAEN